LAEEELPDQEGANLVESVHISDVFENEGLDVEPLIRRMKDEGKSLSISLDYWFLFLHSPLLRERKFLLPPWL
jgi:hypothetical protein